MSERRAGDELALSGAALPFAGRQKEEKMSRREASFATCSRGVGR